MRSILASAYVVVQPNISSETFGMSIAEASALGVPVIVSDVPGLNEIVSHEVNGLLVPRNQVTALTQSLRRILDEPLLANRLGSKGPEWVGGKYSADIHLRYTLDAYERCRSASRA